MSGPPSAITLTMASSTALCGSGSTAMRIAVSVSPAYSGTPAPRRSTVRPIGPETAMLISEATRKTAPITMLCAPKRARRSGSSVLVAPIVAASSRISHEPRRMSGLRAMSRSGELVLALGAWRTGSG